ncbi:MAG: hypothetical protein OEY24_04995 [Candidatus Bathyarchaeota archaeon]|nr:hypothetical protein [Candidatus Bathyarchaeota archaeon]MDH5495038.1 hypothetical protein [Candidatus Bathyarchaeota archaeon]
MTWEESRKKAFAKFPILDIFAIIIVAIVTLVGSIYDETMMYGFPAFLIMCGAILWFSGLRQGQKTNFLYGTRIMVISIIALIVALILHQIIG